MNEVIFFEGKQSLGEHKGTLLIRSPLIILGFMLMLVPGILLLAYYYLAAVTTKYKVTNTRLLLESGIVSKRINSLELWRINDIQFRQNLIEMIFGEGRLVLATQDVSCPIIEISGIPLSQVRALFEKLQPAISQARKENRTIGITA